ncbi:chemotaxis protein CheW [Gilvimarinus algae]|uniref:Chemotaxis protein CheW n=1 Tax=Gilvimarinus algae TaxID=3058037 RepID=A0ABT8TFA5_9GAMM|nr:chemotaxis protein CheW [Gilvimarinus sp. SDUM040014]MDO3382774.1 chemotaxis protein CheW [Gilvimarinus sp. SDUM040014]
MTSESFGGQEKEFLSFTLGDEHYAVDIMQVQEIRGWEKATKIANAPDFIKGVINLRGDIVPVVDLRIKFNVGKPVYNEFTIVIVLQIRQRVVGIVVDSVSDVIRLTPDMIRPAPEFGVAFDSRYLKGLSNVEDHMVILVDIDELITSKELALFDQADNKSIDH